MVRPRLDNSLTRENVLKRMVPGQVYTAYAMAAKLRVPTAQIRPVLQALIESKDLDRARAPAKEFGFVRPVGGEEPKPEIKCSVATAPVHVRLDGVLTGYEAEFRRRAELAMMARGR
jgi:hypothetical protein